jgi:hypothetical protein
MEGLISYEEVRRSRRKRVALISLEKVIMNSRLVNLLQLDTFYPFIFNFLFLRPVAVHSALCSV